MAFNPFKHEIRFMQAVNEAIRYHNCTFSIYRTVEGKVQTFSIDMLNVNLYTGEFSVTYHRNDELVTEKASQQDLQLIRQRARQLAAAHQK